MRNLAFFVFFALTSFAALAQEPSSNDYRAVLGGDVQLLTVDYPDETKTLRLYFSEDYLKMDATTEILVRAAIVKTLTQFSGIVKYVSFGIGDDWIKGEDGQPAKFLKAKPKTDLDKCTNCGICAKVCPMGSISKENCADIPGICIKCQACIVKCPEKAKYFDDEAFLSHVRMLEKNFTERREPEWFLSDNMK